MLQNTKDKTVRLAKRLGAAVAAGTSPHPQGRQAASTASDWSDVLNLDSVSFIDWEMGRVS